jgi:hypothetical protein
MARSLVGSAGGGRCAANKAFMLNGDCPKRDACLQERCDLIAPDLPKVL